MIKVIIYEDNEGHLYRYAVEGHSNYAEHGKDIVCAAVSAISQTILFALGSNSNIGYCIDDKSGYIDVLATDEGRAEKEVQVLFKAFKIGIKAIQEEYSDYVKMETYIE